MAWLREKMRTWLGVTDNPPVVPPKTNPWDDASYKAQDAGDILVACEKRLANDATLLAMCEEFLADWKSAFSAEELETHFSYFLGAPGYNAVPAILSVLRERNRIRVRIAEANLEKAKAALPKKGGVC